MLRPASGRRQQVPGQELLRPAPCQLPRGAETKAIGKAGPCRLWQQRWSGGSPSWARRRPARLLHAQVRTQNDVGQAVCQLIKKITLWCTVYITQDMRYIYEVATKMLRNL